MPTDIQRGAYAANSTFVSLVRNIVARLQTWIAASWLIRTGTAVVNRLATIATTSALAGVGRTLAFWTSHSFLYRWLTAEPDPEVVVIDLRETHTVGPFVILLDQLAPTVARTWQASHVRRATARLRTATAAAWLTESKTIRLLRAALRPPVSPDERR